MTACRPESIELEAVLAAMRRDEHLLKLIPPFEPPAADWNSCVAVKELDKLQLHKQVPSDQNSPVTDKFPRPQISPGPPITAKPRGQPKLHSFYGDSAKAKDSKVKDSKVKDPKVKDSKVTARQEAAFSTAAASLQARAAQGVSVAVEAHASVQESRKRTLLLTGGSTKADDLGDLAEICDGDTTPELVRLALSMVAGPKDQVREVDIAGLADLKRMIKIKIINPIRRPDLHCGLLRAAKGVLLFGPPGTGKTTLAKWIATEAGSTFFNVTCATLISKFHGETESIVKALFRVAEKLAPAILFVDEIDAVLGKRRDKEEDASIRMKNQFLTLMDGFDSALNTVVIVGATNRPDNLDEAALRRLTKRVLVPLPDEESRTAQLRYVLEGEAPQGCHLSADDLQVLARKTDGWNCSDLKALCVKAGEFPYIEALDSYGGIEHVPSHDSFRAIQFADFVRAFEFVRPSANQLGVDFGRWNSELGCL